MSVFDSSVDYRGAKRAAAVVLFCVIGVAVNIIGYQVATALKLPLYLDTVGTMYAAMVGGTIPGIIVGYATNLVNTAFNSVSVYYGAVNVLIACAASFFEHRGWFRSLPKALASIVIFALIGGGLSSIITAWLFGYDFSTSMSGPLAEWLFANGLTNVSAAQFVADFTYDLADKGITASIAVLSARLVGPSVREVFDFGIWHQTPLTAEQRKVVKETKSRVLSLRSKIVIAISAIMVIVALVTAAISYITFTNAMSEEQVQIAHGITNVALSALDGNRMDEFLEKGESAPGYAETDRALAKIRNGFDNVAYLYVYKIREDGCHVIFDPDKDGAPGSDPGAVIPFEGAFAEHADDLLAGKEVDPVISNSAYGWLLTVYRPVTDDQGTCVAYVGADIYMDEVAAEGKVFLGKVFALFLAFFILICAIAMWVAEYNITLPINTIAITTSKFAYDDEATRTSTIEQVKEIDVRTGDEIENLYRAVVKTAEDTSRFIEEGTQQARTIERMQDSLIMVMADLVESRDQFTGDHVRKTAAYCDIILKQMKAENVYPGEVTDEFASDVVHSAPLHDVGKIVVSDTILNKPGRLTEEEFETMKSHTTAGRNILDSAMEAVPQSTYLDEAKTLAEFHHERWDGKGYPTGRSGTEIPLSARIMAVADVFDALVSKRSYKDGMPIDAALAIIREGAGSQFDPLVAQAFLDAEDEVRRIAEEHGDAKGSQSFDVRDV